MKKRVVFCESGYNRFYGAQQSLFNFFVNMDRNIFDVLVLCPGSGKFTKKIEDIGINVTIINYPKDLDRSGDEIRKSGLLTRIRIPISLIIYLKRIISFFKKNKIDLVYCNDIRSILTYGLAARIVGIPVIWYVRIDKNLFFFNHVGANIATKVVLIAENIKTIFNDRLIYKANKKFTTIYTGIDLKEIDSIEIHHSIKSELGLDPDVKLVGLVASIQPRKGQKDLINAIVNLKKSNQNILKNTRFLFIGDLLNPTCQQYLDEINEIINQNQLSEYIHFLGWRHDIINIIKQLDLLVLPSYSEGLPRTILEAFSCYCPVIATNIAGTKEIVNHKVNGLLFEPGDIQALTESLQYMLLQEKTRLKIMGIEGRKTIEANFTIEKYVSKLQSLILNCIKF